MEKINKQVVKLTKNLFSTAMDLVLFTVFYGVELSSAGRSPKGVFRASYKANEMVELIKYETYKRSFYHLQQKGLIETIHSDIKKIRITRHGRKRLSQRFPVYLTKRPWDGKIYLITYDLPEKRRKERNLLREYLRRLGCTMLQASVWVSVYDPRQLVQEWALDKDFEELILVSDVGQDGSIAGKSIQELVYNLYDLDASDKHYRSFTLKYAEKQNSIDPLLLELEWASCVEKDPQLPFELLPSNFSSQTAYQLYCEHSNKDLQRVLQKEQSNSWQQNMRKYTRKKSKIEKMKYRMKYRMEKSQ